MNVGPDPKALRLAREAEGYYELGLFDEAMERCDLLLADGTMEVVALAMKAECLRALERWEEGADAYERVLGLDPENVGAFVGLGWCRKRAGRLDLAIASMERLLAARPDEGIGLYNLACYLSLLGDRAGAIEHLDRAIRQDGDFRDLAREEEDFDLVRRDPRFARLVEANGDDEEDGDDGDSVSDSR